MQVFIGYDPRETLAWEVCAYSLQKYTEEELNISPISSICPLFTRKYRKDERGQMYDILDGKPFSTQFSFARFLVPFLFGPSKFMTREVMKRNIYSRFAIFMDCDFLWRGDIMKVFNELDTDKAIHVVMHDHRPQNIEKMDDIAQEYYPMKCASSFMIWDLAHPANLRLTKNMVNNRTGSWLHAFGWLHPNEIGGLKPKWNHLADITQAKESPIGIHFTEGGPWFPKYENCEYADEWKAMEYELSQFYGPCNSRELNLE